jgi:hypothetical protein
MSKPPKATDQTKSVLIQSHPFKYFGRKLQYSTSRTVSSLPPFSNSHYASPEISHPREKLAAFGIDSLRWLKADTGQKLKGVNARLKHGEGWVGYRYSKKAAGERVRSKFLYYAFYVGATQKFVNSKTNDPEEAYRALLKNRNQIENGDRVLPQMFQNSVMKTSSKF